MNKIKVDFSSETVRKIKPLHGMNSGPMTKVFTYDAREWFKDAGFPFARLHDVEYPYGSGEFVDIPCIFKDFNADETKEENYNFGLTDEYLKRCFEVGCEPFFRLGVSIEHAPVKRYVFPPKDYAKWTRICEHIIRHYTEGWADGFFWNIRYWEIWNEADGCANGSKGMWCGTPEQFYEFYCVSASHLKKCFPHLKIGGGAFTRGYNQFTEDFFKYITSKPEHIPLDFYSWHRYFIDVNKVIEESKRVDNLLAEYGYSDAENIFDEWNYMRDWHDQADSYVKLKSDIGAAFCAAVLCSMQTKTSIDVATYFEADVVKEWCGIFTVDKMSIGRIKATVAPLKPYYAFKSFNELYKMGDEKAVEYDGDYMNAVAASNENSAGIIVVNYDSDDKEIELELFGLPKGRLEVKSVSEIDNFETVMLLDCEGQYSFKYLMRQNSFIFVKISSNI